MRGRYPDILREPKAQELFDDAQRLLERIVRERLFTPRGVYGFFPANAVGDDVELYTDESRHGILTTFHFLRQQMQKPDSQPNYCLADFIAPKASQTPGGQMPACCPGSSTLDPRPSTLDHLGAFAVTAGHGVAELCRQFEADHDDYNSILAKALADRLAEAFAEWLHREARRDWGYGREENLSNDDLLRERYRGIRPAPGYPACPDHTEKRILWELLQVERHTGIQLTESCAMWPAASVSGFYFAHPQARYFGVGKIDRDQVRDYHVRKGMSLAEAERWLGPNLNYDPAAP